jgi:hypothetical protein
MASSYGAEGDECAKARSGRPVRHAPHINHVYRVRSLSDLDAEFGEWLAEAHDVGDGGHLAHPAPG